MKKWTIGALICTLVVITGMGCSQSPTEPEIKTYSIEYRVASPNADYAQIAFSDVNGDVIAHTTATVLSSGNGWTKTVTLPRTQLNLVADYPDVPAGHYLGSVAAEISVEIWVDGKKVASDSGVAVDQGSGAYTLQVHLMYNLPE